MPFFAPSVSAEADALPAFLTQQCRQLRTTAHGLTSDQAALTPVPSALSISGLLAHVAAVVHGWLQTAIRAPESIPPERYGEFTARLGLPGDLSFDGAVRPDMPLPEVLAAYDRAVAFIPEAARQIDLDAVVPGPPWIPEDVVITGRWVFHHLSTEVARHAGHADLIREAIDSKISYELNFLADGGTEEEWAAEQAAWS